MNEPVTIIMEKATALSLYGYLVKQYSITDDQAGDAAASIAQAIGHPIVRPDTDKGAGNH